MNRIAVIGTGITGLSFVNHIKNAKVTLFDKSRKAGGRISTRTTRQDPQLSFDHGMHYLDTSIPQNSNLIKMLQEVGQSKLLKVGYCPNLTQFDKPTIKEIVVGKQTAQSIPDCLLQLTKASFHFDSRISLIQRNAQSSEYYLSSQNQERFGPFDKVYTFIPYEQCQMLKQEPNIVQLEENVRYCCNWTIMLAVKGYWKLRPSNNLPKAHIIQEVSEIIGKAVNQNIKHKPQNKKADDMWVFNMTSQWSQTNIKTEAPQVQRLFIKQLQTAIKQQVTPSFLKAHRWLYAYPEKGPKQPLTSKDGTLVFSGDWVGCSKHAGHSWNIGSELANQAKL